MCKAKKAIKTQKKNEFSGSDYDQKIKNIIVIQMYEAGTAEML